MAPTFPVGRNTFVPSHEATDNMVVDFSRNVDDFAVNKYAQIRPVDKMTGYYLEMTVEQAGRILNPSGADLEWPDGQQDNENNEGLESFEFKPYVSHRYRSGFNIGYLANQQAGWDIIAQHSRIHSQRMMTWRTQRAMSIVSNAGNWPANHTIDVTAIPGATGNWGASTVAASDIKRSLDYGFEQIHLSTLGGVKQADMVLVMSPEAARTIGVSQEIVDHVKGSYHSWPWIRGQMEGGTPDTGPNYSLPPTVYGYNLVIEETVKVTSRKGATKVSSYVCPRDEAYFLARPGALVADIPANAPSFSTLSQFMFQEMEVWTKDDEDNQRHRGRVVENYDTVLTAPISGFRFENIIT